MESARDALQRAKKLGLDAEIVSSPSGMRICQHDQIERAPGQVIIDATTLLSAGRTLPVIVERGLGYAQENCAKDELNGTLNLIQALVIHDHVWVDALTVARSAMSASVASALAPFLSGFLVDRGFYQKVYKDIHGLRGTLFQEFTANHDFDLVMVEGLERQYIHPSDVVSPPPDCRSSTAILFEYDEGRRHTMMPEIPWELADSNTGVARTFFYVAISSHLEHPYMPHPDRSALLGQILSDTSSRAPVNLAAQVVKNFDAAVLKPWREWSDSFPLENVPPVAQHVLENCRSEAELVSRLEAARQKAVEFRKWCGELEEAFRKGRPGVAKLQQMKKMFDAAVEKWKMDVNEGSKYVTRKVSFPIVEKFVKVENVNWEIKDPVLWPGYKPLLFLTSLYHEAYGRGLKVPVVSIKPEEAEAHFGWLALFAGQNMPSSSAVTRRKLDWKPTGPGLIADLDGMDYSQA